MSIQKIHVKKIKVFFKTISILGLISIVGCSTQPNKNGTPSLFNTRAEAEKAAKSFNCVGAHQMGSKWMPCETHDSHEQSNTHGREDAHHHDH